MKKNDNFFFCLRGTLQFYLVSNSLMLNKTKATELAQIGSKYVYEDSLGYDRISEAGVFEIIKKYEEFKQQ